MNQNVSVVILAAGLGTRMKSKLAKVLHRAGGLTLVEHVIRCAGAIAPPERTVAVIGHQADRVRQTLAHTGIGFALQSEQKGTGHALLMASSFPGIRKGRVVVLYGDCPLLAPATIEGLIASARVRGPGGNPHHHHPRRPYGIRTHLPRRSGTSHPNHRGESRHAGTEETPRNQLRNLLLRGRSAMASPRKPRP